MVRENNQNTKTETGLNSLRRYSSWYKLGKFIEYSVIAGVHEQTNAIDLQDQEPIVL
jgi:hypothetical protein